jgi:seryl-tRNA synthetase
MPSYDEYAQNWDQKRSEAAHLSKYLQEAEKMEALTGQVEAMHAGINSMERELHKKQAELQDNHENAGEAYQNVENRKRRIESLVEQKVYNLYNMFSRELAAEDGNTLKLDFSNDENQEFENDKAASQYQANAQSFYGRTLNRESKV